MTSYRYRLDRYLAKKRQIPIKTARRIIRAGEISVNNSTCREVDIIIDRFTVIIHHSDVLQNESPIYLVHNKIAGTVSATKDIEHKTVFSELPAQWLPLLSELHLVGRLDRFTTGLLLVTNDGDWSKKLAHGDNGIPKTYIVHTLHVISDECICHFQQGVYLPADNITTHPAHCRRLGPKQLELTIFEGRHHQIKRMFGYYQNPVVKLHRTSIGTFELPDLLPPGGWQELTPTALLLAKHNNH